MILSGHEIKAQLGGNIVIDPFDEGQLNPNSYNLRLHNELLVYEEIVLDMRRPKCPECPLLKLCPRVGLPPLAASL